MAQSELFPETIINPSGLGYLAAESVNYRDCYSNATLFDLLRALAKSKRIRMGKMKQQDNMVENFSKIQEEEIKVMTFSSIDEATGFLHKTYYNTMMGEGWEKKFDNYKVSI